LAVLSAEVVEGDDAEVVEGGVMGGVASARQWHVLFIVNVLEI
jgi:hypothetical protein